MKKPLRHFWEGKDTSGREVRATLVEGHDADKPFHSPLPQDTKFPAVVFRAGLEWKADPHEGYRVLRVESINRLRASQNKRLLPPPRMSGVTWPICAVVSLLDVKQCIQFRTPMGLESKFRPGMARLTVEQLGSLSVALTAWMESGGKSMAKSLRMEAS